jgi:acetylornithine deacetylase/succinyl-diaminopimelate desuccinylase-like protein
VGAVRGSLLHTRDEWVDLASLEDGLALVLSLMLQASDAL